MKLLYKEGTYKVYLNNKRFIKDVCYAELILTRDQGIKAVYEITNNNEDFAPFNFVAINYSYYCHEEYDRVMQNAYEIFKKGV